MFKIYLKKNYIFHSINNPIILGRNITSEVNISVSYLKSLLILIKEISQILLIGLLLLFASFKVSIFIFIILTIFAIIYFKLISKPLKEKVKVAYFERGEKSKIVNQILNSIIEIKLYQKSNFLLKNLQSQLLENLSLLFFMKSSLRCHDK